MDPDKEYEEPHQNRHDNTGSGRVDNNNRNPQQQGEMGGSNTGRTVGGSSALPAENETREESREERGQ